MLFTHIRREGVPSCTGGGVKWIRSFCPFYHRLRVCQIAKPEDGPVTGPPIKRRSLNQSATLRHEEILRTRRGGCPHPPARQNNKERIMSGEFAAFYEFAFIFYIRSVRVPGGCGHPPLRREDGLKTGDGSLCYYVLHVSCRS